MAVLVMAASLQSAAHHVLPLRFSTSPQTPSTGYGCVTVTVYVAVQSDGKLPES